DILLPCTVIRLTQRFGSFGIESFFGVASCTTPSRTTPHTRQVDAFQDQRQIAHSHLDSGRRSRSVLTHSPRSLRYFKGSAFQSLVPNDEAVAQTTTPSRGRHGG